MFRRPLIPFAALLGILALSCGEAPVELAAHQSAVMNAELSPPELDGVVRVVGIHPAMSTNCTGTLVAPNLVLTALHCVAELDERSGFACTIDGELDSSAGGGGYLGATFEPSMIHIYTGVVPTLEPTAGVVDVTSPFSDTICQNDIAILVLDRELEAKPLPMRLDAPTDVGEPLTMIGYGLNETSDLARRQRSGNPVLAVGPSEVNPNHTGSAPRTFMLGAGACKGDSGGPALSDETGAAVGVFSIVGEACGSATALTTYTQIAPYREMIREAFEASGQQPMVEDLPEEEGPTESSGCQLGTRGARIRGASPWLVLGLALGRLKRRTGRAGPQRQNRG